MTADVAKGGRRWREAWLRVACLAVSVGLHAGVGVIGWQGFKALSDDDGPIVVALIEGPSKGPMLSASSAHNVSAPRSSTSASPRKAIPQSATAPAQVQVALEQKTDPLCVVPEAAVAENVAESAPAAVSADSTQASTQGSGSGAATSVALVGGGVGTGDGTVGQGSKSGGDGGEGGGIIKATPRYESNPLPNYPRLAKQNRWEGTVRLRARVTAAGNVEDVALERSSGYAVLDRSALDGVLRWRFIPATRNGVPVACEVSIPVAFRLAE